LLEICLFEIICLVRRLDLEGNTKKITIIIKYQKSVQRIDVAMG